jgi:hypothetical protein
VEIELLRKDVARLTIVGGRQHAVPIRAITDGIHPKLPCDVVSRVLGERRWLARTAIVHLAGVNALEAEVDTVDVGKAVGTGHLLQVVQVSHVCWPELKGVPVGLEGGRCAAPAQPCEVKCPLDDLVRHGIFVKLHPHKITFPGVTRTVSIGVKRSGSYSLSIVSPQNHV